MSEETIETTEQPSEAPADETAEPETFSAEYVRELRAESAERRVKAKRVDEANTRLARAYATQDGRLVDTAELSYGDHLLDDDGLVDVAKVTAAIDELLKVKPYLANQRPQQTIAQGVREDVPEQPGLFALLRERV